jgi:hypothetical protein
MAWAAITLEGGLLPADLLDRIATGEGAGQAAADFGVEGRLSDAMQRAFSDARAYWEAFTRRRATSRESATTLTREAWIIPLLETLGFPPLAFQRAALAAGGETFPISHLAGDDPHAPPVHIVGVDQSLERRERGRRSPHALVQEYLNRSDALWGIVTNGERLRLLRDSTRIAHPTFIEFDLQGMIEGNLYSEFTLLYRLLHGSRFPRGAEDAAECVLERLYQEGIAAGGRVREKLSDGGGRALEALGNGFLAHPESGALRERLASGALTEADYYRQLLRLVYRLLFLFVAEERRLLFDMERAGAAGERREIYDRYYSAGRLRERCERPYAENRFSDLWPGLRATFGLFRDPGQASALGLTALNGELFGEGACRDLEGAGCDNVRLLRAIFHLSTFRDEGEPRRGRRRPARKGGRRRVNYAGLDVEELGSVYESLLELQPAVDLAGERRFHLVASGERKETGSYYTPSSLVHELIESALAAVLAERLAGATTTAERERAILGMTVCDPAAGSGHFLLAAARRMGRELARVRTGAAEPTPADFRQAVRDVIRTCIYAVDKNPLAVDLCKVALWIEGHATGLPLGFLDHHVKCGDSLVGVFDLDVLREGIPDEAYAPVAGDDKGVARAAREANKRRKAGGQLELRPAESAGAADPLAGQAEELRLLAELPETTAGDVRAKEALYRDLREEGTPWWRHRVACDLWTAAFFAPLVAADGGGARQSLAPTSDDVFLALDQPGALHGQVVGQAQAIGQRAGFFHWPLEFPEVFAAGGFDVILSNPPWERIKLQEQEFFAQRDPAIAAAPNAAARKRLIAALPETNPALAAEFDAAIRDAECASKFLRGSGGYPLTGRGDINTYSVFSEANSARVRQPGRAGMLVPTGIATDDTNKAFFAALVDNRRLVSLYDFENREGLFPSVDSRYKFSLLTTGQPRHPGGAFDAAFFLTQPAQLDDPARVFTLSPEEIALLNPNTRTAPIFRSARDAEITKRLYRAAPVLVREGAEEANPWRIRIQRIFDMAKDMHMAVPDSEEVRCTGHRDLLPIVEAKMIHQYDHRFFSYDCTTPSSRKPTSMDLEAPKSPLEVTRPRFWMPRTETEKRIGAWNFGWLVAYRDIARNTDERTLIATVIPFSATDYTLRLLFPNQSAPVISALVGNWNSFTLDYISRQKISGTHMSDYIAKQLPVLPPETYTPALLEEITPRVLELVYTAWDLAPFARDLGYQGAPFPWDEERRARLRAELDGLYARLYGLSRDDFADILDQFPIVRRRDEAAFGEYRTKRLCLEAYDGGMGGG